VVSRAKNILEAVDNLHISEGIPWGKGPRQVLSHLKTELGDDTKKKISLLNRTKGKMTDPKKIQTLEKVLSMLQADENPAIEGKKSKEPDHVVAFNAKAHAVLGDDEGKSEPKGKEGEKEDHKAIKAKVDAALGDEELSEKPPQEKGKKASDLKSEIEASLGGEESKTEKEEPKEKKSAVDLKSEIDAALGGEDSVTKTGGKPESDVLGLTDLSSKPEKIEPPEPPVVGGESLGGGPGMAEVSSIYAKKETATPEASKILKSITKFAQNYPSVSRVLSAGLAGVNAAVAHYQSAKSYKENPTSSTGMVSKHPVMTSALIGGPTGVAASASYFARKEEGKPRAEVWENVADFAGKHPKTSSAIGGGGVNPALAYYYASKQKKPKKQKTEEIPPESLETSNVGS
jgi:hypothetical protein